MASGSRRRTGPAGPRVPVAWRGLPTAFSFLTVFPVRPHARFGETDLQAAVPWFPVAGAVIGALSSLAAWLGDVLCGPPVGAAFALTTGLLVTRGLHLDGLADTADGLAGGWGDRSRVLEIMRDSRIGSIGAAAVGVSLLLRFSAIAATGTPARWLGLIGAPVAGRLAVVFALSAFSYAGREGGTGAPFARRLSPVELGLAVLTGSAAILASGGPAGLIAAAAALLGGLAVAAGIARKLGGLTGDCYGAVCEAGEILHLLVWAVRW